MLVSAATEAVVDLRPTVTSLAMAVAPAGGWTDGDSVRLAFGFSAPVTVATDGGAPSVGLSLDGTSRQALYASGTGTASLMFAYTVTGDDGTVSQVTVAADGLATNGGTIRDADGRDANLAHAGTDTSAVPAAAADPLTASFAGVPEAHDGSTPFTFKLTFSEAPDVSNAVLSDDAFTVSGGTVKTAQRAAPPSNLQWNITIEPSGDDDVTVGLTTTSDCAASDAICTSGGTPLTGVPAAFTVAGPEDAADDTAEEPVQAPLTASFSNVPATHGGPGSKAFTIELAFSEEPQLSYATLRNESLAVRGGSFGYVRRQNSGSDVGWTIRVRPSGWGDVTVTLAGGRACATEGAICTEDGKVLANTAVATVAGPLALSVADAQVDEAENAVLAFQVTLNRAATGTVTVGYATADGTATAGADYTATSDTLTFQPGETVRTVNVAVLDDTHDDTGETMTLVLSNAVGARLRDGEATGTIGNSDPIPQAWLARFGRAASDHVMQAIDGRLRGEAQHTPETHFTFGGRQVDSLFSAWNGIGAGFAPTGADTGNPALVDEGPWARMDRLKAEALASGSPAGGSLAGGSLAGSSRADSSRAGSGPMGYGGGSPEGSHLAGDSFGARNPAGGGPAGGQAARSALMNSLGLPTGDLRGRAHGQFFLLLKAAGRGRSIR